MTHSELMDKELIRIADLQAALDVPYDSAARIIRSIKAHSDLLGISGAVCHQDYVNFMTRTQEGVQ